METRPDAPPAYHPVSNSAVNPNLTTAERGEKRTEGEATINTNYPTTINLGVSNRKAKIVIIGMGMDGEDVANAEYIKLAWNMHEDLVDFVTMVIGFSVCVRQANPESHSQEHVEISLLYAKASALLSRCK